MFLLDPNAGRRRRGRAREQLAHAKRRLAVGSGAIARDFGHRVGATPARLLRLFRRSAPDEIVEERVRSALGRVCSHPRAIDVICVGGDVQVAGAILKSEHRAVVSTVRRVRGVKGVDDLLEPHASGDQVPDLQGGVPRPGPRPQMMRRRWGPALRFTGAAVGVALLAAATRARGIIAWAVGGTGTVLLARGLFNAPVKQLTGVGAGRHAVAVEKTIRVRARTEELFALWSDFESFPRYMTHVREVRRTDDGRYHWKVGPFEWDAEVTRLEPNRVLSWRSLPGTSVENAGTIHFRPVNDGEATEISIHLSYNPPAGLVGHGIAKLLGADPKKQMDDDLLRFKSLAEQGKAKGRGPQVMRKEITGEGGG